MHQVNLFGSAAPENTGKAPIFEHPPEHISAVTRTEMLRPAELVSSLLAKGSSDLALLDRMPVGLSIHDAHGAMVHANAYFARLVDCHQLPSSPDTILRWQGQTGDGRPMPSHDFPCSRALRGETVSPGVDLMHFGKDGQGRWLNVSAAPITDPGQGEILGIVLLYIDAHETVQAAAFGARAARRFRQFAENSGTAIWIADVATGEFTYRNPLHLKLLRDHSVSSIADWMDHVDEADRRALRHHYDNVREGRSEPFEYGLRATTEQRGRRLRETSFPIRDDAGAIVMIGGMTDDVTPANPTNLYLVGQRPPPAFFPRTLGPGTSKTKVFGRLAELLEVAQFLTPGCVVIDLATTPDADSNLARALAEHAFNLPIILIGKPETHAAIAVSAMRAGAADYLVPPFSEDGLGEAVDRALARFSVPRHAPVSPRSDRLERLSKREREVLAGLKAGGTNKSIARELQISPRTVELHRSHLMERLNVRNLAELLQFD